MEQLLDELQLVSFLMVSVAILAVLVTAAIGLAVFLYTTNRKIAIVRNHKHSQETGLPVEMHR